MNKISKWALILMSLYLSIAACRVSFISSLHRISRVTSYRRIIQHRVIGETFWWPPPHPILFVYFAFEEFFFENWNFSHTQHLPCRVSMVFPNLHIFCKLCSISQTANLITRRILLSVAVLCISLQSSTSKFKGTVYQICIFWNFCFWF